MNPMDMSDDKESNERYQISKNDEVKVSDVIEDLKLGKLISHKNLDNVEKESDVINQMDMSDENDSDERDQISKNDEVNVSDVIEDLKLGKLILNKNIDNVEKESDKRNRMDMSDNKESSERYEISKNDDK